MEMLFGQYRPSGCTAWQGTSGETVAEARPPCAVLARALRGERADRGRPGFDRHV